MAGRSFLPLLSIGCSGWCDMQRNYQSFLAGAYKDASWNLSSQLRGHLQKGIPDKHVPGHVSNRLERRCCCSVLGIISIYDRSFASVNLFSDVREIKNLPALKLSGQTRRAFKIKVCFCFSYFLQGFDQLNDLSTWGCQVQAAECQTQRGSLTSHG